MAILGVIFKFFYVAFFVMCGTMGYLFHVWGDVDFNFLFFLVISIFSELFCFGRGIGITCS